MLREPKEWRKRRRRRGRRTDDSLYQFASGAVPNQCAAFFVSFRRCLHGRTCTALDAVWPVSAKHGRKNCYQSRGAQHRRTQSNHTTFVLSSKSPLTPSFFVSRCWLLRALKACSLVLDHCLTKANRHVRLGCRVDEDLTGGVWIRLPTKDATYWLPPLGQ